MTDQFFVFGSLFDYCEAMCQDLNKLENCQFINTETLIKSKPIWFLYKVHNSGILNRWFRVPFRSIWYGYLFDKNRINMRGGGNHFVFFDSNPHVYDPYFLTWIRNNVPNSSLSIIFVNSMKSRNMRDICYFKRYFGRIYTTDYSDAAEYGFEHVEGIHSKINSVNQSDQIYDLTFVGANKGRAELLADIYSLLIKQGWKCNFTITGIENPPKGIHTQRIPYQKLLEDEIRSRAILEVCASEQNANTQRALEAIMYDKVLITNNSNVKNNKYYDSRTMIVFSVPEELAELDLSRIPAADYGYKDDFSPNHILADISHAYDNSER